ncbi:hypothetical protein GLAREA_11974 [Glarea lozoyensis ATCC 20868]|uniref:Uncharacterized protein n=1 Tax=Glarea lozoyensis (strain ATCC 20868 / MF5171) TaxID=1116229 RepID=S3D050_GLAL2|nr:uncharacterized protein GLAREA_11974 [Glarea lozoyensis ATCC 20868]EPE31892.1 hypothetical protein GLAREA_11974 [Glarea lozoyensis ATCC 20868]
MDFHTRKALNIYPQNEEPFYHASSYSPDDMVYEGSDTELTDDELRIKRLRYEDHAQKYMRGCLPVLQSARLRGPLEDRSEWSHPWRYHPPARRTKNDKPGPFRRVLAGSGIEGSDGIRGPRPTAVPSFATSSGSRGRNSSPRISNWETTTRNLEEKIGRATGHKSSREGVSSGHATAVAHNTSDGLGEERRIETTRQKRAADSQWLKGSYVSKRARWHEADIETPTPNPQLYNQRFQWKAQGTASAQDPRLDPLSSKPLSSFPDIARPKTSTDSQETSGLNRTIELSRSVFQHVQPSEQLSSMSNSHGSRSDYMHYAQQPSFNSSSPNFQPPSALALGERSKDGSYLALQAKHTPDSGAEYSNMQYSNSVNNTLPALPGSSGLAKRQDPNTPGDEVSFVTEVAPSSRNLEEFQFKKRRIKGSFSASASGNTKHGNSDSRRTASSRPVSKDMFVQYNAENVMKTQESNHLGVRSSGTTQAGIKSESGDEDDDNEEVLAPGPYVEWYKPTSTKNSSLIEAASQDDELGSTQNSGDLKTPYLSSRSAANLAETVKFALRNESHGSRQGSSLLPVIGASHGSQNLIVPCGTAASYPQSQYKASGPRRLQSVEPAGSDGSSTQSFNTTPAKSSGISLSRQSPFRPSHLSMEINSGTASSTESSYPEDEVPSGLRLSSGTASRFSEANMSTSPQHVSAREPLSPVRNGRGGQSSDSDPGSTSPLDIEEAISDTSIGSTVSIENRLDTPKVHSQITRPGEQSPWTKLDAPPLPKKDPTTKPSTITSPIPQDSSRQRNMYDRTVGDGWHSPNHESSPENINIKMFSDILTPSPPPRFSSVKSQQIVADDGLTADVVTENPWTSTAANKASSKSNKRVSFGVLSDTSEGSSQEHQTRRLANSPPPPNPIEGLDTDELADINLVPRFSKHFTVFKEPKGLSQNESVSMGSPSIGAMAEAFIAADQETSIEEERRLKLAKSARHLKPTSPSMVNAVRRESATLDTSHLSDDSEGTPSRDVRPDVQAAGFDMDDALGSFADFLGDWSVEGELQKARNSSQAKTVESNGAKRRRLFGIV